MMRGMGESMPVLENLAARIEKEEGDSLKGTVVLHINHCMGNSYYFTEILHKLFSQAVFVGVPYNDTAVEGDWSFVSYYGRKRRGGYELWRDKTCMGSIRGEFMETAKRLIGLALEKEIFPWLERGKKLLILEDGGYHYPVVRRFVEKYPGFSEQIEGCVEQTASGTVRCRRFGEKRGYLYPCASISRSDIKMHLESRFIGHRVVEELAGLLYGANAFLDFHHVLLLGYGIVGRQVAMDLKCRNCRISVLDTDERIRAVARSDGFYTVGSSRVGLFETDTIIVGSTGKAAFTCELAEAFFKGKARRLYLASSSSQDVEFRVFLDMAEGKTPWPKGAALVGKGEQEFFATFYFEYGEESKEIVLMAEGLPVNFYRKNGISLTYSVMDLIFAQMLSAAMAFQMGKQKEKKLWLVGDEQGAEGFLSERELASLWFSSYRLMASDTVDAKGAKTKTQGEWDFPRSHPEADYLRRRMLEAEKED